MPGVINILRGVGGVVVTITDQTISDIRTSGTASASYMLTSGGAALRITSTGGTSEIGAAEWIVPRAAAGSAYEARATLLSGSLSSGTTGSWLALSTNRTWTRDSTSGVLTAQLLIEIRLASSGTVLDTATITLEAEVAP